MTDYENMKIILNKGNRRYRNPVEEGRGNKWKTLYGTDFLLLCDATGFLFVFDNNGTFKFLVYAY